MRLRLACLVCCVAALPLGAQDRIPTAADTVCATLAIARSDLRNLVVAQEVYFSEHASRCRRPTAWWTTMARPT
ncbi:MAG TPA: hypothetical protein PK788_14620 [Gemmatimonadaceae bacterium]|nr:hypothetical protein [Gemmatimonadaceae bacterium]